MRTFKHFCAVMIVALLTAVQSNAQKTMDGMQLLTIVLPNIRQVVEHWLLRHPERAA